MAKSKVSKLAFHSLGENRGAGPAKKKPTPVSRDVQDTSKAGRNFGSDKTPRDTGRELKI